MPKHKIPREYREGVDKTALFFVRGHRGGGGEPGPTGGFTMYDFHGRVTNAYTALPDSVRHETASQWGLTTSL